MGKRTTIEEGPKRNKKGSQPHGSMSRGKKEGNSLSPSRKTRKKFGGPKFFHGTSRNKKTQYSQLPKEVIHTFLRKSIVHFAFFGGKEGGVHVPVLCSEQEKTTGRQKKGGANIPSHFRKGEGICKWFQRRKRVGTGIHTIIVTASKKHRGQISGKRTRRQYEEEKPFSAKPGEHKVQNFSGPPSHSGETGCHRKAPPGLLGGRARGLGTQLIYTLA